MEEVEQVRWGTFAVDAEIRTNASTTVSRFSPQMEKLCRASDLWCSGKGEDHPPGAEVCLKQGIKAGEGRREKAWSGHVLCLLHMYS